MQQKKLTQSLIKINILKKKFGIIFLIISIGCLTNFYSGYRGVFPLDSFLIYEAGYKVLNNYFRIKLIGRMALLSPKKIINKEVFKKYIFDPR